MQLTPGFYSENWKSNWDPMKLHGPTARHTRRLILRLLDGLSFDSVLDAGCGTGILLEQIGLRYPQAELTGTEYAPYGLEIARQRVPAGTFHVLDLAQGCLPRQFDLITCIDVLEHIPDDRVALGNLLTMTGRYLVVSVPLGPLFKIEQERMGHVHGYTRAVLEGRMRAAGFEIVRTIQWGFPFYNLHRRLANLMPASATAGSYCPLKRLASALLYGLFFLNLSPGGERYYALCQPAMR